VSENFRNWINQGVQAAQSGNRELAEHCFRQAIQENPQDARGWYYYALAVTDPTEARRALEITLQLDPYHQQARARLNQGQFPPAPVSLPPMYSARQPKSGSRGLILLGFVLVLVVGIGIALWALLSFGPQAVDDEIEAVINANIRTLQEEDLAAYMDTIDPASPLYDQTEQVTAQLLDLYDLTYEIEKMEMVRQSANIAKVRVVQVTRKISGPTFRNNRITAVHELHRVQGEWLIYNTVIEHIDYLN